MVKENLTVENIKKDLLKIAEKQPRVRTKVFKLKKVLAFAVLVIACFCSLLGGIDAVIPLIAISTISFEACYYICDLIDDIQHALRVKKYKKAVESQKYTFSDEKLISIDVPLTPGRAGKLVRNTISRPVFCFESGEKWLFLYDVKYYEWSKELYLSGDGLYNSSMPGDEFYTVRVSEYPDVSCIYNKKFFTFNDYDSGYVM